MLKQHEKNLQKGVGVGGVVDIFII